MGVKARPRPAARPSNPNMLPSAAPSACEAIMAETLGFVGVGKMGGPMASRLLDAGHRLTVYDIRPEASEPLAARGAALARSSRAVADAADIVFFSLPEPEDVAGEALGEEGVI